MKYFIFDLGSVVVKPMKVEEIYNAFKWTVPYDEFKVIFSNSEAAKEIHKGTISTKEYFEYLQKYVATPITFAQFLEAYKCSKQYPYEETINIIKMLKQKGHIVCLLSNLRKIDFKFYQEKFDTGIFDQLFLSYELKLLKPDPEIYKIVINKLSASPEQIYFFDDLIENVEAARRLGINAYQVTGETIKKLFTRELESIL